MEKLLFNSEYFNAKDTLECGQVFRFKPYNNGYLVYSLNKVCYIETTNGVTTILTDHPDYFKNYFDLNRDYKNIVSSALLYPNKTLNTAVQLAKGVRILNQNLEEAVFSFIISQNNNIPRIKSIIEKLCLTCGNKISSPFGDFYSFPTATEIFNNKHNLKNIGLGYRDEYLIGLASQIANGYSLEVLKTLDGAMQYKRLLEIKGVGPKVANCIILFGLHNTFSFPVDTWILKIYKEDFNGNLSNTQKITEWFINEFKENSGYFQQYLFYFKRSLS